MQDVLIVIGAAIFANVLLLGAIGWFLMRARRLPKAKAVQAPVALPAATAAPRPGRRSRLRAMIDGSVGMFLFRKILGRPTDVRSDQSGVPLAYLDEDVVASRIGAAPMDPARPVPPVGPVISRPNRIVVAGSATAPLVAATAPVKISPPVASPPSARRNRLVRDTFVMVGGFAVVLLFAAALLPGYLSRPNGEVLDATGTPESSAGIVITAPPTASQVAVVADAVPIADPCRVRRADRIVRRPPPADGDALTDPDRPPDREAPRHGTADRRADTEAHGQADPHPEADAEAHAQADGNPDANAGSGATDRDVLLLEEWPSGLLRWLRLFAGFVVFVGLRG